MGHLDSAFPSAHPDRAECENSVTEIADNAVGENTADDSTGGKITFTDADTADTHTASFTAEGGGYLDRLLDAKKKSKPKS